MRGRNGESLYICYGTMYILEASCHTSESGRIRQNCELFYNMRAVALFQIRSLSRWPFRHVIAEVLTDTNSDHIRMTIPYISCAYLFKDANIQI